MEDVDWDNDKCCTTCKESFREPESPDIFGDLHCTWRGEYVVEDGICGDFSF